MKRLRFNTCSRSRRQKGLTLVELMIGMTLGLLVLAGVLYVFMNARQTYHYTDAVSRLQENGRIAIDTISTDLRRAGYAGCLRLGELGKKGDRFQGRALLDDAARTAISKDTVARSYVYAGAGAVNTEDTLSFLGGDEPLLLASPLTATNADIQLTSSLHRLDGRIKEDDTALIADCEAANLFAVTDVSDDTVTVEHDETFAKSFARDALVIPNFGRWHNYYVRQASDAGGPRTNRAGQPIRSLYRQRGAEAAEELVEGVHAMRIRYGIGSNGYGPIEEYVDAAAVTDWSAVIAIRIQLLLATVENNMLGETQPAVTFGDGVATFLPNDRRMYQAFTSTVALRNRLK